MGERKRVFRGDRLRSIRDRRGFTQDELSYRLSIGQSQLARYENGRAEPTPEVIARLASELDVTADYLLGLSESPAGQLEENDLSETERRLLAAYRRVTATTTRRRGMKQSSRARIRRAYNWRS